ncbi:MAG: DEDD exonuclease domain-containing protein [Bacteroidota bacterium]|nr:DEDD exonuclease domain-containing protein [Candidatus Kapabacteria bacterium]MCX7937304.1 DEDD exonuclease domain-containing protein [Chlorobiota bacterium]MDW8075566.1 DEDD exonuclease domain-containing protein [Bacteroidota bacterium]
MQSLWDATYIVTDVETTGSHPHQHRIIEIACVVVQGGELGQRIHSLVNPHQFIPPFIEQLTGITNADVYAAPEESEVLPLVAQLLSLPGAVFVAHNEHFDWRFVQSGLQRCGLSIGAIPRVCTLRLARRLLPAVRKKNLDAIAEYFGIPIHGRHRALGDAEATAHILVRLLEEAEARGISTLEELLSVQHHRMPNGTLPRTVLNAVEPYLAALPDMPGVYTMRNKSGEVLYVGKAKSLAERVRSYFLPSAAHAQHIERMLRQVRHIEWEETPTELSALLLEYQRIQLLQPPFNVLHRRTRRYPLLRLTNERFPRLELAMHPDGTSEYFGPFPHRGMAEELRDLIEEMFQLRRCAGTLNPSATVRPCFYYHLRRCGAPCAAFQTEEEYAAEVERVRRLLHGNVDELIALLEQQMHAAAEQLEFERAQRLRNRIRELQKLSHRYPVPSASISRFNIVLAIPTAYEPATVELFVFFHGRLIFQQVVGRCASLQSLVPAIEGRLTACDNHTPADLAILRIVTSWMYQNHGQCTTVPIEEAGSIARALATLQQMICTASAQLPDGHTERRYIPIEELQ